MFKEVHDYWDTCRKLIDDGFSVRLNCTMTSGLFDTPDDIAVLVEKCRENGIHQLTVRPVTLYEDDNSKPKVVKWTNEHLLSNGQLEDIRAWFENNGTPLLDLSHGAKVYDVDGQNACLSNCLTSTTDTEDIRQFIFFPDGHLRYDWKYEGAVIF